jgi:glutathione S-transferase
MMKLFTFATSPYARKVRIVLDYKGIAYEPIERCYSLDRKEDLRSTSERAEVPVLVLDDGRSIADSTIISEYLEQAFPAPPVYPRDAFERSKIFATAPSTPLVSAISSASCARRHRKRPRSRQPRATNAAC